MQSIERRFNFAEVRAEGTASKPALVGYAAVFNTLSKRIPTSRGKWFYETVAPSAFTRCLRSGKTVIANYMHDMSKPLATTPDSLQLVVDSRGLRVHAQLNPDVSWARDVYNATKSGEIRSMSFAFNMPESGDGEMWDDFEDEETGERCAKRTLLDCEDLSDVAFCTTGTAAYDAAFCDARSLFPNGTSANVEVRR